MVKQSCAQQAVHATASGHCRQEAALGKAFATGVLMQHILPWPLGAMSATIGTCVCTMSVLARQLLRANHLGKRETFIRGLLTMQGSLTGGLSVHLCSAALLRPKEGVLLLTSLVTDCLGLRLGLC